MGDEEGQAEPQGLQDLQLLDGLLARGRQDAQCAPGERQEDGCKEGQAEGQGDEGGGAGLPIKIGSVSRLGQFLDLHELLHGIS